MRRTSLSLLILGLALLVVPATSWAAGPAPQGNALTILGAVPAISQVAGAPAALPDTTPTAQPTSIGITQDSTCSVTIHCDNGATLSCSGTTCSTSASNPSGGTCGSITCNGSSQYCTTYHRNIRDIPNCCYVSGGYSQKWASQTSCNNSTWYTTGYYCSGPCIQ